MIPGWPPKASPRFSNSFCWYNVMMRYVPVRTSTLRPGATLLFDVYVLFRECYLKFRGAEGTLEPSVLDRLKAKKVKKLYIPEPQEPGYLQYLDQALEDLTPASGQDLVVRAELAQGAIRQASDNIGKALESEQEFRKSEARIQKVADFFSAEPKALAGILAAEGLSVDESAHGATVSTLALALGSKCGFGRDELTDLAVAGLLHDSGLAGLGFDVKASLATMEKDKRAAFRGHPAAAAALVAGKKFITPRVLRLIEDHEEFGEGLGYPARKNYFRLQPDSQAFNLCDAFDHFCVQAGQPAAGCIEAFIEAHAEHYDAEMLGALEGLIKV